MFEEKLQILDKIKLDEYIHFCINNNEKCEKIYCENHHILPISLFPEYGNFKLYPKNKTRLTYSNHLYAHYLIACAIKSDAMLFAFNMMSNFYDNNDINIVKYQELKTLARNKIKTSNWTKSSKNKKSMFKNGTFKYVKKSNIAHHIDNGWIFKNNVSGTIWVNDGNISKRIKIEEKELGWSFGRMKTKSKGNSSWINNGKENKRINNILIKHHIDNGWSLGVWNGNSCKNKVRINKNNVNKTISKENLSTFLCDGWTLGAFKVYCSFCNKEMSSLGKQNHKCKGKEYEYNFYTK